MGLVFWSIRQSGQSWFLLILGTMSDLWLTLEERI